MTTIRTPRLALDPVRAEDRATLHAHWTEPDVRRFLWDGEAIAPAQVDDVIATSDDLFRDHGVGLWSARMLKSETLIGCCGFWHFHDPPELELLVSLSSAYWGRGFALEAAGTLLTFAFRELGWQEVQASADAPNLRSLELMRRLGMRPVGERPGEFGTIQLFRIAAADWPEPSHPPALVSV